MWPGRGGALSAAALPELRGPPGRCGRPDRAGNGVSERRQSLDATAPVRGVAPPAVFCRGSRRLHRSGRVPGSRLSARSAWRRRMMGIRGVAFQGFERGPGWPQLQSQNGRAHVPSRDVPCVRRQTEHARSLSINSWPALPQRAVTRTVQAAAGTAARGSKSVPVFHIACRITASLRASATAARLKPTWVFGARAQRRSVLSLCTRVRIETAAS